MKKHFLLYLFLIMFIGTNVAQAQDMEWAYSDFLRNLKYCSPYNKTVNVQMFGMNVIDNKRIVGFQNNKCLFIEKTGPSGGQCTITCKYPRELLPGMNKANFEASLNNEAVCTTYCP